MCRTPHLLPLAGIALSALVACAVGPEVSPELQHVTTVAVASVQGSKSVFVDVGKGESPLDPRRAARTTLASDNLYGIAFVDAVNARIRTDLADVLGWKVIPGEQVARLPSPSSTGWLADLALDETHVAAGTHPIPWSADTADRLAQVAKQLSSSAALWVEASCALRDGTAHVRLKLLLANNAGAKVVDLTREGQAALSGLMASMAPDRPDAEVVANLCGHAFRDAWRAALASLRPSSTAAERRGTGDQRVRHHAAYGGSARAARGRSTRELRNDRPPLRRTHGE